MSDQRQPGADASVDARRAPPLEAGLPVFVPGEFATEHAVQWAKAEMQAQGQTKLLELVLSGLVSGVIVADANGRLILMNRWAAELFNLDPQRARECDWRELPGIFFPDQNTPFPIDERPLSRALRGETVRGVEMYICPPGAKQGRWVLANAGPLVNDDGRLGGGVAVYHDETDRKSIEDALRKSEVRFRRLLETAKVVPWEMNLDAGKMTYVGPQAEKLLGYPLENWYGVDFWQSRLHPADREWVPAAYQDLWSGGKPDGVDLEYRLIAADGSTVWVRDLTGVIRTAESLRLLGGFMFDVTDRKNAERALQENEARYQAILDSTPAVIYLKDAQGHYLFVNRAHERMFGVERERLKGKTGYDLFPKKLAEQISEHDRQVLESDRPIQFEETVPTQQGPRTYLSLKFPLRSREGTLRAVCGISTDITQRMQAEEGLRQEQNFLRNLIKAHERDRQLMAYEIHDGLVQDITAGLWHLEGLDESVRKWNEREQLTFDLARSLLRRSIGEARRVLSGLRPPILDEEGIIMAIQYLVAEQAHPGQLDIQFHHDVHFDRLDPLLEGTIFRIVQEALNNIKRHSHAHYAEVELTQHDDLLRLAIRDFGQGFRVEEVPPDRFGLQGIRKRAALMGGRAEINTSPGQGTRVNVELPLVPAEPRDEG